LEIDNISVKELPGNHAVQATTANRPIYGIHPVGGRRNLLTWSEQFDNASWTKVGVLPTYNAVAAPDGTLTADLFTESTLNEEHYVAYTFGGVSGSTYTWSVYVRPNGRTWVALNAFDTARKAVWFNCTGAGTVGTTDAGVTGATITALANGWYRLTSTRTASATSFFPAILPTTGDGVFGAYLGNGTSGAYIWGAQLETGSTATAYQRVTDQYNVTEAGVSSVSYLFFDGVNDSLATPSINFATATSDGQARRNLLTFPTAFNESDWLKIGATVTANAAVAPDGTMTADALIETTAASSHTIYRIISGVTTYTHSFYAKANGRTQVQVEQESGGNARFTLSGAGTAVALGANTVSITSVGDGWYRCSTTFTPTAGFGIYTNLYNGSTISYTGDGTSGVFLWGAQLETGTTASAFQNIGTDKMTVFAGVRKLSDASVQSFVELSAAGDSNNGAFYLRAPESAAKYSFLSRGTGNANAIYSGGLYSAPTTNVLTGIGNISGDVSTLRADGTQAATSTADQGTGTYGNYPLFIGARNSASLFFSGHLYSLIVRGAQSTADQISYTEAWVAGKTGFFKPVISGIPTVGVS
jgi:hypothetical protein